jgi:hypothetical protein
MEGFLLPNAPPLHKPLSKLGISGSEYNIYHSEDLMGFFSPFALSDKVTKYM